MSPSAPSGSGTASSSSDLRPITVMIVDDQRATRMGLSLIINRADDLQVTAEAVHGQDALDQLAALLEERRPLPDVVLMDVRMPGSPVDRFSRSRTSSATCPSPASPTTRRSGALRIMSASPRRA